MNSGYQIVEVLAENNELSGNTITALIHPSPSSDVIKLATISNDGSISYDSDLLSLHEESFDPVVRLGLTLTGYKNRHKR